MCSPAIGIEETGGILGASLPEGMQPFALSNPLVILEDGDLPS